MRGVKLTKHVCLSINLPSLHLYMYLNVLQEKISCNVDMFILKHTFCHVVFVFVLECNIARDQVQRRHISL